MNDPDASHATSFEERLAAFLDARDRGEAPVISEWMRRHPEHASALRTYLEAEDWLADAAAPLREPRTDRPDERPIEPPAIDGYTLGRELARGGMGVVFEAVQHEPKRTVAIKTLRDAVFATEDDVRRFRREAQAAAELDHPGIVRILALGEVGGRVWFSMPLATGGSLADHLPGVVGDHTYAARLVRDVARAVAHGHTHGILHRDLKPSNILLDARGDPLVADFGLARRLDRGSELHTQTGTVLGTPAYMAPEQARGDLRAIDERTDVWSLGAILYHLVAGRPPFVGAGPGDTLHQVLHASLESLRRAAPGTPRALAVICETCLRKDPGSRYPSMRDLADDLDRHLRGRPIHAKSLGWFGRTRLWVRRRPASAALGLVSVVAVAAIVAALLLSQRGDAEEDRRKAGEYRATARALSEQGDVVGAGLYFAAADARLPSWAAKRGLAAHATPIPRRMEATQSGTLWRVRCSPTGHTLAAGGANGIVYLWGAERLLGTLAHDGHPVRGLAFSPDGLRLATGAEDGTCRVWDVATKTEIARVALPGPAAGHPLLALAWVDDRVVALGGFDSAVYLWSVGTRALKRHAWSDPDHHVTSLVAAPNGKTLLVGFGHRKSGARVRVVRMTVATGSFPGSGRVHTTSVWDCAWTRDGKHVATSDDVGAYLWSADGFRLLHEFPHDAAVGAIALSGDGSRLVTATTKGVVRAFDTTTGVEVGLRRRHAGAVYGLAVNPQTGAVASVGIEGLLRVWPISAGRPRCGLAGVAQFHDVRVSPGARASRVLVYMQGGYTVGALGIWSPADGAFTQRVEVTRSGHGYDRCHDVAAKGDGWLALMSAGAHADDDQHVQLVDVRLVDGQVVLRRGPVLDTGSRCLGAMLSQVHDLVLLHLQGELGVYGYGPGRRLRPLRTLPNAETLALSPSGDWLIRRHPEASRRFTVERSEDGTSATTIDAPEDIGRVALSADGRWAALSLRSDRYVLIYDVEARRVQARVRQAEANLMRFAAEGRILLATGRDSHVRAWATATGELVGRGFDMGAVSDGRRAHQISLDARGTSAVVVDDGGEMAAWDVAWMTQEDTPTGWARRRRAAELAAMRHILSDGSVQTLDLATWRAWRKAYGD